MMASSRASKDTTTTTNNNLEFHHNNGPARSSLSQRWVTWGMDMDDNYCDARDGNHHGGCAHNDDLVVKVWSNAVATTPKSRNNTSSSAGSFVEDSGGAAASSEALGGAATATATTNPSSYRAISRISMPRGAAARVHPSFPDGIVVFRDNPSKPMKTNGRRQFEAATTTATGGAFSSSPTGLGVVPAGGERNELGVTTTTTSIQSPVAFVASAATVGLNMRASPKTTGAAALAVQTPPSPPPLMLEETTGGGTMRDHHRGRDHPPPADDSSVAQVHEGWEAELWRIEADDEDAPFVPAAAGDEAKVSGGEKVNGNQFGARKVAAFCGGGVEEDALSFAPGGGRGAVSDVIAVDLALTSSASGNNADVNKLNRKEEELSLCVLTKAGRMTVYGVPEASELLVQEKKAATEPNAMQHNKRARVVDVEQLNAARSLLSTRVYRHQSSTDNLGGGGASSSPWWNKKEEEDLFGDTNNNNAAQESPKKSPMESMRASVVDGVDPASNTAAVRRAASRITENIAEMKASATTSVELSTSMEEVDREGVDTGAAASSDVPTNNNLPIDTAAAARVPCPPLCGVAFSGVGGLVTFSNGPVKRMWSYYQSNELMSPNNNAFKKPPNTKSKGGGVVSDDEDSVHDQDLASQRTHVVENQTLPRSLADLVDMNLRSQSLQWGYNEQEEDAQSDGHGGSSSSDSSDGSSSYDDGELLALGSDESGGLSDDSDDSEGFYHVSPNDPSQRRSSLDNMFDDYFSSSRKSLLKPDLDGSGGGASDEKFAGLPSLSPSVVITRAHDNLLLNGQTPELATMLELGDCWWLTKDFTVPISQNGEKHSSNGSNDTVDFPRNSSSDPHLSMGLFSSDRMRIRSSSFSSTSNKTSIQHTSMMGNLRKLFAHQLPTAMTPPDQRLLKNKSKQMSAQIHHSKETPDQSSIDLEESCELRPGVYTLENPQTTEAAAERLAVTHKLCIQNADVCSGCGQEAKADTWTLLAQTIESIFTFEMDETDGWGGDGDALTSGIVEHILRYYEGQGDFQMLSSILCVLTFGRDRRCPLKDGGGRYQLLPKFDHRRYDNYLRRYAALLYGWGVLTVRAEISKRLAYSTPGAGSETITKLETNISGDSILPNAGVAPGVTFSPFCGRCKEPVNDSHHVCPKCNEYAFQCSICCNAVRGACTWCPLCGHGGHVNHMIQWFQQHKVCPTGCGCICMLESTTTHPRAIY